MTVELIKKETSRIAKMAKHFIKIEEERSDITFAEIVIGEIERMDFTVELAEGNEVLTLTKYQN